MPAARSRAGTSLPVRPLQAEKRHGSDVERGGYPEENIEFRTMRSMAKRLGVWAAVVALLLLVPLIAMQFTDEVAWTLSDFVFAGILLIGSALVYELATRNMASTRHRFVVGVVVATALATIWVAAAT
jgi:hypothetical protein